MKTQAWSQSASKRSFYELVMRSSWSLSLVVRNTPITRMHEYYKVYNTRSEDKSRVLSFFIQELHIHR